MRRPVLLISVLALAVVAVTDAQTPAALEEYELLIPGEFSGREQPAVALAAQSINARAVCDPARHRRDALRPIDADPDGSAAWGVASLRGQ